MHFSHIDTQQILRTLQPSRGGALLTLLFSIVITVFIMTPVFIRQLDIQLYTDYIASNPTELTERISKASEVINGSKFAADISVFIVWSLVGAVSYLIVSGVIQAIRRSVETIDNVEHAVVDKKSAERELIEKIAIQISAVVLLYFFYILARTYVLPTLTVLSQSALKLEGALVALLLATMIAILFVSIHIVVVLLRFILLRTRLFFSSY